MFAYVFKCCKSMSVPALLPTCDNSSMTSGTDLIANDTDCDGVANDTDVDDDGDNGCHHQLLPVGTVAHDVGRDEQGRLLVGVLVAVGQREGRL